MAAEHNTFANVFRDANLNSYNGDYSLVLRAFAAPSLTQISPIRSRHSWTGYIRQHLPSSTPSWRSPAMMNRQTPSSRDSTHPSALYRHSRAVDPHNISCFKAMYKQACHPRPYLPCEACSYWLKTRLSWTSSPSTLSTSGTFHYSAPTLETTTEPSTWSYTNSCTYHPSSCPSHSGRPVLHHAQHGLRLEWPWYKMGKIPQLRPASTTTNPS